MTLLAKYKNSKFFGLHVVYFVSIIFVLIASPVEKVINNSWSAVISNSFGNTTADSNVVLITIDENDINNLKWPLKRSYYALLINKLLRYEPSAIGLEIFLSDNLSYQSVYNSALNKIISSNNKIVLGSIAQGFSEQENIFIADTILKPSPLKDFPDIATGHLNYASSGYLTIPSFIKADSKEYSLSVVLAEKSQNFVFSEGRLNINVYTDWKNYTSMNLMSFFKADEESPELLTFLTNKIILVGVTAPSVSKTVTVNGKSFPGLAMHAYGVDNILNNKGIKTGLFYLPLAGCAIVLLLLILVKTKRIAVFTSATILLMILFSLVYLNNFYIFNYAVLIVPFLLTITASQFIGKERVKVSVSEPIRTPKQTVPVKTSSLHEKPEPIDTSMPAEEFEGIVYRSDLMRSVSEMVIKVAPEDATVLILGESGTGKELIARALHNRSSRSDEPFVAVNCAALSDTLLESELFGHVKGAFTGADRDKKGRFETARNGTIFLDELGEVNENFQVKLLRILQNGDYERVGSSEKLSNRARIVAATNKNLEELVKQKKFREDLYYRLNIINITLPPLKERREDVSALAEHFVKLENPELKLSDTLVKHLESLDWPGNVRELESTIKRAVIFAKFENRTELQIKDLPEGSSMIEKDSLDQMILYSLRSKNFSHSSISETAKELGNLNRNLVSENFRGIVLKAYSETGYDLNNAAKTISLSEDVKVIEKVISKGSTYLNNLTKDLEKIGSGDFDFVRAQIDSKYKNLPQKFHPYLDDIVKNLLK